MLAYFAQCCMHANEMSCESQFIFCCIFWQRKMQKKKGSRCCICTFVVSSKINNSRSSTLSLSKRGNAAGSARSASACAMSSGRRCPALLVTFSVLWLTLRCLLAYDALMVVGGYYHESGTNFYLRQACDWWLCCFYHRLDECLLKTHARTKLWCIHTSFYVLSNLELYVNNAASGRLAYHIFKSNLMAYVCTSILILLSVKALKLHCFLIQSS